MKRFRLSTLLLLVVIAALSLALIMQERRAARREAELQFRLVIMEHMRFQPEFQGIQQMEIQMETASWTKRLRRGIGGVVWVDWEADIEGLWSDTLGFPAAVAGFSLLPRRKGYHDVKTQKPHDPGHATRRVG